MKRNRRTRVQAGLLGLIALGLSFSEAVLASVRAHGRDAGDGH